VLILATPQASLVTGHLWWGFYTTNAINLLTDNLYQGFLLCWCTTKWNL